MNIKFKSFSMLLAMAAALSMTACKEEALPAGGENLPTTEEDGSYLYINAGIALPTAAGTRSSTDEGKGETNSDADPDFEYGYDYENDVRSMILVIADKEDNYIAHTVVKSIDEAPSNAAKFDFVVKGEIKYEDLEAAYKTLLKDDQTVHVYAYCNYTARVLSSFEEYKKRLKEDTTTSLTEWLDWHGIVEEPASPAGQKPAITNTIWASRSFLMTNYQVYTFEFPEDIDHWDPYTDKNNPYMLTKNAVKDNEDGEVEESDLTPIKVERAAARLDFRDGSLTEDGKPNDNTYPLKITTRRQKTVYKTDEDGNVTEETEEQEAKDKNLFNIKLTRMSLVNMSNKFYYMRRVSDDGLPTGKNFEVLGTEKKANFVVDVDHKEKNEMSITPENAGTHFNFPLYSTTKAENAVVEGAYEYNRDGWFVDNISDVLKGESDTWSGSVNNPYKIWRYVTENTIAGVDEQITVQSVGIVFKGAILGGADINSGFDFDDWEGEEGEEFETKDPYVSTTVKKALAEAVKHSVGQTEDGGKGYNYPILYSFHNMLFGGAKDLVYAAAADGQGGELYNGVNTVLSNWKYDTESNQFVYQGAGAVLTVDIAYDIYMYRDALENAKADKTSPDYADYLENGEFSEEKFLEAYRKTVKTTAFTTDSIDFIEADAEKQMWATIEANLIKHAPANGITVYRASDETDGEGWGYYCYYFYWNRHNDNLRSGKMGEMEFATVRNNVYKLSVTTINGLGHTRIVEYDSDPGTPKRKDEDPLAYIQVQVEVLPWVVRVNDIEF